MSAPALLQTMAANERLPAFGGAVVINVAGDLVREVHLRRGGGPDTATSALAADLRRYFAGERVDFSRYRVDFSQYTLFERAVLEEARRIPYGQTRTYGEIAKAIGRPDAARAVGLALGKNHTCIVVPCHRVVAKDGLGGFSGGIRWKQDLLALEGALRKG